MKGAVYEDYTKEKLPFAHLTHLYRLAMKNRNQNLLPNC